MLDKTVVCFIELTDIHKMRTWQDDVNMHKCYAISGERMQHAHAAKVAWIQAVGTWKVVLSAGVAQA